MSYSNSGNNTRPESLDDVVGDPGRMQGLTERISTFSGMTESAVACTVLGECARTMGVESAAFATFLEEDPWRQSYRFILACRPAWCAEYQKLAWFADDPWLIHARTSDLPALSSEIPIRGPKQQAIIDLARRNDVESALIIRIPSVGKVSRLGVLMLGSSNPEFFTGTLYPRYKVHARSLAHELHDWYVGFLKNQTIEATKLSETDITLLRHERAGLTTKEIAKIMCIEAGAVDSRFQRINARLGVANRRAAARVAAEYAII